MKTTVMQYKRKIQDLKHGVGDPGPHSGISSSGGPGTVSGIQSREKEKVFDSLHSAAVSNNRNNGVSADLKSVTPILSDSGKTKFPLI